MKLIEKIMRQNNCISWELALFINKKLIENNDPTMATSNKVRIQLYRRKKGNISGKWKNLITYALNQFLRTDYGFDQEKGIYDLDKEIGLKEK